jgi:hypothetical protein
MYLTSNQINWLRSLSRIMEMTLKCPRCNSIRLKKAGIYSYGNRPNYYCSSCHKYTANPSIVNATIVEKDNVTLVDVAIPAGQGKDRNTLFWRSLPIKQGKGKGNEGKQVKWYGLLVEWFSYEWRHHRSVFLGLISHFSTGEMK